MTTFNQWYEDGEKIFHSDEYIYFSSCGVNGNIHLAEFLKLLSDAAVEDYNQRGMSREFLKEKGFAILVSRCAFRFHRIPKENEKVSITTWEETPEALQLIRGYEIRNEEGELLVSGDSSWLLMDINARRLLPTAKFTLREPSRINREKDCMKPGKIKLPEDAVEIDTHVIKYSDLDANGHTNNGRYGCFIEDALPPEYHQKKWTDFRLNYCKEAMLGQTLKIFAKIDDENKKIIMAGKTETETSFEAELYWAE